VIIWLSSVIFIEISVSGQNSLTGLQIRERKPISRVFFLLCSVDSKAPIHDFSPEGILHIKDIFTLTNKRRKPVKTSYRIQENINCDEKTLSESLISLTLKPCSISKQRKFFFTYVK